MDPVVLYQRPSSVGPLPPIPPGHERKGLKDLIHRVENLLRQPDNLPQEGTTLEALGQEATSLVRSLAFTDKCFEGVLSEIERIKFSGFWLGFETLREYLERQLRQLRSSLVFIIQRLPAHESEKKETQKARKPRPAPTYSYSPADEARFERIGREQIKTLMNAELYKRHRVAETALKPGLTLNAFRASLNRIRSHYGLPSSSDLRKNVREKK